MRQVFLSIGHNMGKRLPWTTPDRGATGNGTDEFAVSKLIVDQIMAKWDGNAKLIKVPEGLNLDQRIAWINKYSADGDIAIEFHLDSAPLRRAGDTPVSGCSTWYMTESTYAMNKAKAFQMEYTRITGMAGRGVHGDTTNRLGRLGFVRDTKPLALLFEQGFISNELDLDLIRARGSQAIISALKVII